MKKLIATIMVMAAAPAFAETTQDHYKQVIVKKPYNIEVCTQGNGRSNLNNFLEGAIIGGIIGNNIPGEKGGGALGAILGGAMNTESNKGTQCRRETRYDEEYQEVYSHSTVTFNHNGRTYTLRFQK
jgi:outer membrane lipoprotein SlyB